MPITTHTLLINKTEAEKTAHANKHTMLQLGFMKQLRLPQVNAACFIGAFIVISKHLFAVSVLEMDLPVAVTHDWGFRCKPRTIIDSSNTKIREESP